MKNAIIVSDFNSHINKIAKNTEPLLVLKQEQTVNGFKKIRNDTSVVLTLIIVDN